MTNRAILYTFRRCPYAIRARMALANAKLDYEHREVLLKDKPPALLQASPKGTVPVLIQPGSDAQVLDESLDIMRWALRRCDPTQWLADRRHPETNDRAPLHQQLEWVRDFEASFKPALDAYKYTTRWEENAAEKKAEALTRCLTQLRVMDQRIKQGQALFASTIGIADVAAFPFVRQFANVDPTHFATLELPALTSWLNSFLASDLFQQVMQKHPRWVDPNSNASTH